MKSNKALSKKALSEFNIALHLQNKGDFNSALINYKKLLKDYADIFEIKINIATCHFALNNFLEAAEIFHELHIKYPKNINVLNGAAAAYTNANKLELAWEFLKRLVTVEPNNIGAWINITYVTHSLGKQTESLYYATHALSLNPKEGSLYNNLGSVLQHFHRYKEALICYETTLDLSPNDPTATLNIAVIDDLCMNYEKSIAQFEKALWLYEPGSQKELEAKYRMSFPLLATGQLERGWNYYEYGFLMPHNTGRNPTRTFEKPRWEGQKLITERLLIWREQGIGDEVWFFSLLTEVFPLCKNIVIECSQRLLTLFQRSFPTCEVRTEINSSDYDFQIPVGSLCKIFRNSWDSFNFCKPYLIPKETLKKDFKERLSKYKSKTLVGITWRSGNLTIERNIHYVSISEWERILKIPSIQFVNLQYGDATEEIDNVKEFFGVEIINFDTVDIKNDLESVAAIISNLDLVISVGSFTSPFSQAIGTKVKLIGHKGWTTHGKDYWPWYEDVDLYYPVQKEDSINSVFGKLYEDLCDLVKK